MILDRKSGKKSTHKRTCCHPVHHGAVQAVQNHGSLSYSHHGSAFRLPPNGAHRHIAHRRVPQSQSDPNQKRNVNSWERPSCKHLLPLGASFQEDMSERIFNSGQDSCRKINCTLLSPQFKTFMANKIITKLREILTWVKRHFGARAEVIHLTTSTTQAFKNPAMLIN